MKKYIIITILMIFGMIPIVKAETFTNSNMSANFTINFTKTITNTFQQEIINSTNGNDFQWNGDYKYLYIYYGFTHMLANENITSSNINYSMTCASYNQSWDLNEYGTIYYQDGSTATIEYVSWTKYCEQWNQQGQDFTKPNINNTPNILVTLTPRSGAEVNCFTYDTYVKCPINNVGKKIQAIKIGLWGRTSYTTNYNFRMFSNVWLTNDNEDIVAIQQQTQQQQQNWNNFNNSDISSQSKTPLDTSQSDSVNQKETQIYDVIKQSPNELDILSIDLDPDTNSWIWNTINTLIAQHRYITILFVSIMTIGVAKLIFGR